MIQLYGNARKEKTVSEEMMARIMDGKALSEEIMNGVSLDAERLNRVGIDVGLGLMLVGENPASRSYLRATLSACKKTGIKPYPHHLPENASINEILNTVAAVNHDERINGLLILLPMPRRINSRRVINEIVPHKDVDGLGSLAVGRLAADESTFQIFQRGEYDSLYTRGPATGVSSFLPCTPFGVIRLLEHSGVSIRGKHAVVIGKSLAVGKPLSLMLLAKEATVTVCHKATEDLAYHTRQADILCSATGIRGLITGDMVKEGAVVVDIGINVLEDGAIVGDVDFSSVEKKASHITPVPGGVGPVTIAILLENTVRSGQGNQFLKDPLTVG